MGLHSFFNTLLFVLIGISIGIITFYIIRDLNTFKTNYNTEQNLAHSSLQKAIGTLSDNDTHLNKKLSEHDETIKNNDQKITYNTDNIASLENSLTSIIDDKYSEIGAMISTGDNGETIIKSDDSGMVKFNVKDPRNVVICGKDNQCSRIITRRDLEELPIDLSKIIGNGQGAGSGEGPPNGNINIVEGFEEKNNLKFAITNDNNPAVCGFKGDKANCKYFIFKQDIVGKNPNTNIISTLTRGIKEGAKGDTGARGPRGQKGEKGDKGASNNYKPKRKIMFFIGKGQKGAATTFYNNMYKFSDNSKNPPESYFKLFKNGSYLIEPEGQKVRLWQHPKYKHVQRDIQGHGNISDINKLGTRGIGSFKFI